MRVDAIKHVSQRISCTQTKDITQTAPMLEYPIPAGPFGTVAIGLLQLTRSRQRSTCVFVCVNHFSRFVVWPNYLIRHLQ